jgi:L,D-peptidoglycan transpeptidase YkuD (ErfK/YbiS/YcfS/YnhG family)
LALPRGIVVKTWREIKKKTGDRKSQLRVLSRSASATQGCLTFGNLRVRCALGRSGQRAIKREGDGATPIGQFGLVRAYYRADRILRPRMGLPLVGLRPDDGWCDATGDRNYNRHVRHPYTASAERMWRDDGLYDVVVVLDYNLRPRAMGRGSAIFLHCARDGFAPTEGCVAVRRADLVRLLEKVSRRMTLMTGSRPIKRPGPFGPG